MPVYEPIPVSEKAAYGSCMMAQNLAVDSIRSKLDWRESRVDTMLGMSTTLVGHALLLMRIWDAFTDQVMGWISDNTKSRWGRRRPFVFEFCC